MEIACERASQPFKTIFPVLFISHSLTQSIAHSLSLRDIVSAKWNETKRGAEQRLSYQQQQQHQPTKKISLIWQQIFRMTHK